MTKRLQDREIVLNLGDNAVSQDPTGGPALAELRKLAKTAPEDATRAAASGQIAKVMSFWGSGVTYLDSDYQITTVNGKPAKQSALTTCDLFVVLRSNAYWKDRAQAAQLLAGRQEKGVPEALISATADPYLDVVAHAILALRAITGRFFGTEALPGTDELKKWWAKEGRGIAANFKPLECK